MNDIPAFADQYKRPEPKPTKMSDQCAKAIDSIESSYGEKQIADYLRWYIRSLHATVNQQKQEIARLQE